MEVARLHLEQTMESVHIAAKTAKTYQRDLRSAVRGLWSGVINFDQAFESFQASIYRHFTQAWQAGAKECGIAANELTERELAALNERIVEETQHISKFLEAIEAQSKANGGKLQPLFNRLEMWVNRWNEVFELGESYACADEKRIWVLGRVRTRHCRTCLGLAGRVYRYSVWRKHDALPKSSRLECFGGHCNCSLRPTDLPITRGRFPAGLLN